jgi:hypothetical protein
MTMLNPLANTNPRQERNMGKLNPRSCEVTAHVSLGERTGAS